MDERERRTNVARQSRIVFLVVCFLFVFGGVSCEPQSYRLIDIVPKPIDAPDGYYHDIAWIEPDTLAMVHSDSLETHNTARRLMILNTESQGSRLLPYDVPPDCARIRYGRINRLPDVQLGYLWECIPHATSAGDFALHQYDLVTQYDQELYRYQSPYWPTAFAFESMMERWLQEEAGDGLSNSLYLVQPDREPTRLLEASFARTGHPFWMPDGQIVFAGTPNLPESGFNLFSGLRAIRASLNEPWTIYMTDLESLLNDSVVEEQIILSDIQYIEAVKASSDGQYISFLGTIGDNQGLWIYQLESGQLARLWAGFGPYDWSPDSSAIVILVREPEQELFRGRPARIELPESLTE